MLILDLWGISFHAVVLFGLGKNLLFKSILGRCGFLRDDMTRLLNLTLPVCVVCLELLKVLIPRHALMNKRGLFCFIFLAKSWPDQKLLPLIFVFENVSRLDSPGQTWRKKTPSVPQYLYLLSFFTIFAITQENLYLFLFFS